MEPSYRPARNATSEDSGLPGGNNGLTLGCISEGKTRLRFERQPARLTIRSHTIVNDGFGITSDLSIRKDEAQMLVRLGIEQLEVATVVADNGDAERIRDFEPSVIQAFVQKHDRLRLSQKLDVPVLK